VTAFEVAGIPIDADTARDADDGTVLFEPDGEPVLRLRTGGPLRCRCSHVRSQHSRGAAHCWLTACGCQTFREQAPK
jgi:hypothetical protein